MFNPLLQAPAPFDYSWLMDQLKDYKVPRAKVTALLRAGDMIRIKKGLYVPGESYGKGYSRNVLANLIYGPSYVSRESALAFYGLIPERVTAVTSVTMKRNKRFQTPLGLFDYAYLTPHKYAVGITREGQNPHEAFLIATPEKALCDSLAREKDLRTAREVEFFLAEGLRLETGSLANLDIVMLDEIAAAYRNQAVNGLLKLVLQIQKEALRTKP